MRCSDGDYIKTVYPQSRYSAKSETESCRTTRLSSKNQQNDPTIDHLLSHIAALTEELQQRDIATNQRLDMLTDKINALRKDLKPQVNMM
jgi:hypothetical protein